MAMKTMISKVVAMTSLSMLVLGLPFTCHGGIHMFNVFNESVNILIRISITIFMDNELVKITIESHDHID